MANKQPAKVYPETFIRDLEEKEYCSGAPEYIHHREDSAQYMQKDDAIEGEVFSWGISDTSF